jgi:hypothetical protein
LKVEGWVESRAGSEHCTGNIEEAIGDGSQGAVAAVSFATLLTFERRTRMAAATS